jgi:hypothetical protein
MHVPDLFLPRFETIDIAEEPRRLKDIVFLHFLFTLPPFVRHRVRTLL